MKQHVVRVYYGDSYTTVWRMGDRLFHTFTHRGEILPVESDPIPPMARDWSVPKLAGYFFSGGSVNL